MRRSQTVDTTLQLITSAVILAGCARQPTPPPQTSTPPAATAAIESPAVADSSETTPIDVSTTATVVPEVSAATTESQPAAEPAAPAAFYSVAHYDENQDPTADLAATIERATAENKRILLQVGGEWCGWCHRISSYMETNEKVRELVDDHFIVMKVTYPGAHVESFLEQYPRVEAYPHLFVLEPDGKFLHSQGTSELEFEKSYNEEVFCKFLSDWVL